MTDELFELDLDVEQIVAALEKPAMVDVPMVTEGDIFYGKIADPRKNIYNPFALPGRVKVEGRT